MELIEIRRKLLMADPELPPTYTRVDYLQSSGTQYINTGLTYTYGYKVNIEILDPTPPYDTAGYLGWWNSASQNNVQSYPGSTPTTFVVTRGTNNAVYSIGTAAFSGDIIVDGLDIRANGYSYTANNIPPDIGVPFTLFGYNRTTGVVNCAGKCRIRSAVFFDSNHETIRNFVPCIRGNKPGMYETVTKAFFTNQGTGEFIVPN